MKGLTMKSDRFLACLAIFLSTVLTASIAVASGGPHLKLKIQMVSGAGMIEITDGNGFVGLEYTTNLDQVTPWLLLATVQVTSDPFFYSDASAVNAPRRFYRAYVENSGNTNALNSAPSLNVIENKTVQAGTLLTFIVTAKDADIPAQKLVFTLEAGAPAGAAITSEGLFFLDSNRHARPQHK